jgi:hypothetical protein
VVGETVNEMLDHLSARPPGFESSASAGLKLVAVYAMKSFSPCAQQSPPQ